MAKYKVKDINKNGKIDSWEQAKYDAINKSSDSPTKFIAGALASTVGLGQQPGTASYGGLLAQQQANQMTESPVNPRALGGLQNQIPNITGTAVPGMYDRVLPSPLTNNHDDKKLVGENTGEIKKDKKGREYSLVMEDSKNFIKGDTIRPANNKTFKKSITTDGYIMGGDYKVDKRNRIINK